MNGIAVWENPYIGMFIYGIIHSMYIGHMTLYYENRKLV